MLDETDEKRRQELLDELTGVRTTIVEPKVGEENAPSWWRGEDEAYAETMASLGRLPQRRR